MTQNSAAAVLKRKLDIMRKIHALTEQELLLVNLEQLSPLLERKDEWIAEIQALDVELAKLNTGNTAALEAEIVNVVGSILENERTLEARIEKEHNQLRQELRALDKESRLRRYLEHNRPKGGTLNVRK
ncbi:MAG: hypothetical protein OEW39_13180 [Deltaproteobacteria bacterium]|nr:hypothetical protein [Deltaproteobacteria bacterium]